MATPAKPKKPKKTTSGVSAGNLDHNVKPTVDFYQYACGGWMASNPLGDEYARYGSFDVLAENNQAQLQDLVTKIAAQKNAPGTVEQKIGDFYNTAMNTEAINKQGAQPLQPALQDIAKLQRNDLSVKMARMLMERRPSSLSQCRRIPFSMTNTPESLVPIQIRSLLSTYRQRTFAIPLVELTRSKLLPS